MSGCSWQPSPAEGWPSFPVPASRCRQGCGWGWEWAPAFLSSGPSLSRLYLIPPRAFSGMCAHVPFRVTAKPLPVLEAGEGRESIWRDHLGADCQQHPGEVVDLLAKLISGRFGDPSMRHGRQWVCRALPTFKSTLLPQATIWRVLSTFFPYLLTLLG